MSNSPFGDLRDAYPSVPPDLAVLFEPSSRNSTCLACYSQATVEGSMPGAGESRRKAWKCVDCGNVWVIGPVEVPR